MKINFTYFTNLLLSRPAAEVFLLIALFMSGANLWAQTECSGDATVLAKWSINGETDCNGERNTASPRAPIFTGGRQLCPSFNDGCGQTIMFTQGFGNTFNFSGAICLAGFWAKGTRRFGNAYKSSPGWEPTDTEFRPENVGGQLFIRYNFNAGQPGVLRGMSLVFRQSGYVPGGVISFQRTGVSVYRNGVLIHSDVMNIMQSNVNGTPIEFTFPGTANFRTDGNSDVTFEVGFGLVQRNADLLTGYDDVCILGSKGAGVAEVTAQPATCAPSGGMNGQLTVLGFSPGERYDFNEGTTYTGGRDFDSATPIPTGGIITNTLPLVEMATPYTVRVFRREDGEDCFLDATVVMPPTFCPYTCDFPDATVTPNPATCAGDTRQDNASIVLTGITNIDRVGISTGRTYTGQDYDGATPLPAMATTFTFPDLSAEDCKQFYTIRLFNGTGGPVDQENCIQDITVSIDPVSCDGCAIICADLVDTDSDLINPPASASTAEACRDDGFVDIAIIKTASPDAGESCPANTEFTWTLTVSNEGTMTARDITVRDLLPDNMVVLSDMATEGMVLRSTNHIDWVLDSLEDGATQTLTIVSVFSMPGSYQNCATLASVFPANDPDTSNDESCDEVTVTGTIRPSIEKAFSPLFGQPNVPFRLILKLFNNDTTAIALTQDFVDSLPIDPAQMSIAATPNLVSNLPNIIADPGSTFLTVPTGTVLQPGLNSIEVSVVAPAAGVYVNEVAAGQLETTGCSNAEPTDASIELNANFVLAPTIAKSFSAEMIAVGQAATLTLTIENQNTQNMEVAEDFADFMPPGLIVVGATGGTCPGASTFGSTDQVGLAQGTILPPGPCTITVQVEGTDPGLHCNLIPFNSLMVDVLLPGGVRVATSNQDLAEDCIEVVSAPIFDLALRKTLAPMQSDTVDAGGTVSYAITVFNQGTAISTGIQIVDYIPAELTLIDDDNWEPSGGNAVLENAIPSLAPGADTSIIIRFDIDPNFGGEFITNSAEISSANGGMDKDSSPDSDPTNDNGGLVQSPSDNVILGDPSIGGGTPLDGNGLTDEDDADPAIVFLRILPDDLNCTLVLSATPGDCMPATGTYDLTGSLNFSEAPTTGDLTISLDGTVVETIPVTAMSPTSPQAISLTGLPSDGLLHTVTATFTADAACSTSFDYTAPNNCADAGACTVALTAIPGDCDPTTNSYALSGAITFTDAPTTGTVTVSVGPFTSTYAAPFNSPLDYQITGLSSNGSSQTVSVAFSENTACTNTADYVAPAGCLPSECSIELTAMANACVTSTNLFTITGTLAVMNAPAAGTLIVSTSGASDTFMVNAIPANYTLNGLISDGTDRTVTAVFSADPGCRAEINLTAPEPCSDPNPACAISLDLEPSPCVGGDYTLMGTITFVDPPATGSIVVSDAGTPLLTIALPTSSPLNFTFPGLMADGVMETLTVAFSEDASCTNTASFVAPAACGDNDLCNLSASATEVSCEDNGTQRDVTDDYITFKLNPTGTSLGLSYSVTVNTGQVFTSSGNPATNIPYGTETMFRLGNGSIGAGNVTLTLTDDTSPGCIETVNVTDPGTPCSDCTDPTATLTPMVSTCTGATENDNGVIIWTSSSDVSHYGVSSPGAAMYDGPTTTAAATEVPMNGDTIVRDIPHAGANYIIRIFNVADDCSVDVPVMVEPGETCMLECMLSITAAPGPCDNADNSYDLVVTATYSNPPTGNISITVAGGTPVTFTPDGTSPDMFTINDLDSDGTMGVMVSANFVGDTNCEAMTTYNAPGQCSIPVTPPMPCQNNPGDIGGTVFLDLDNDGTNDAEDNGQAGMVVMAYDCDNNIVGSTTTDVNGDWTLTGLPNGADDIFRVEFSFPPALAYLQAGAAGTDNGTDVQFATPVDCNVDFGVVDPSLNCQDNPLLVTNCYLNGTQEGGVIVSWNYDDAGLIAQGRPAPTYQANNSQIGTTWGLAYENAANRVLTSAFLKRHSRLLDADSDGNGDLGAIYEISMDGNLSNDNNPLWLNLDGATDTDGNTISLGTIANDVGRGINVSGGGPSHDPDAFDKVGKVGLGDIDLNASQDELWVVNLWEKKLHGVAINPDGSPGVIRTFDIPDGQCNGTGPMNDARPFAVRYYQGGVYVGVVCSGENTGQLNTMTAYVYRLDDDGVSTTFTEVLSFPLEYRRDEADSNGGCNSVRNWLPWTDTWPGSCCCNGRSVFPQPILSDIEFNITTGEMILGFIDRFGHQSGFDNYSTDTGSTMLFGGVSAGEILKSTPDGDGTFTIETLSTSNALEFYLDDFVDTGNGSGHFEIGIGGLALIPGGTELVSTAFDPINGQGNQGVFISGGTIKLSNANGQKLNNQGYQIFNGNDAGTLGKAAGLGDLELLCDRYPIEIGNYVWIDEDEDGVQDGCEPPVPNLPVTLINKNTGAVVAVTTTDPTTGEYYFTEATDGLEQNTPYAIIFGYDGNTPGNSVVDGTGVFTIGGNTFTLTTPDGSAVGMTDLNDSDASLMDQGSLVNYPIIMYTTGDTTDHTLDVGIVPATIFDLALIKELDTGTTPGPFSPGDMVQFTITVTNQGSVDAFDVDVADYFDVGELSTPSLVPQTGVTDNTNGTFTIETIAVGSSVSFNILTTIEAGFTGFSITNNAEITGGATTPNGANEPDVDSTPGNNENTPPETGNDDVITDNQTNADQDDDPFQDDYDPAVIPVLQDIDPIIEIADPCTCFDVEYDLPEVDPYEFLDSIKVTANTGQPWRVYDFIGIESIDSFVNVAFPMDTLLTEFMPGMYSMRFAHTANMGYTIFVTNTPLGSPVGTPGDTLSIGATCFQPEPFTPNLPFMELICPDDPIALEGAANFMSAPLAGGSFTYDIITGPNPGDTLFNQTEITANQFTSGTTIGVLGRYTPPTPTDPTVNGGNGFCGHTFFQEVTFNDDACGVFDLALIKEVNTTTTPGPYEPGGMVQYTITVTNQGEVDAFDIDVADYFDPAELSTPVLVALAGVSDNNDGTFTIEQIAAGASVSFDVVADIDANFVGSITNNAEITRAATSMGGPDATDEDSTPDNNSGTPPETGNDNIITDNEDGTPQDNDTFEDDFDPAVITVEPNCTEEVVLSAPFSICSTRGVRLNAGASIFPGGLGGTWSTPDGTGDFTTGQDFDAATTYIPSPADIERGSVTLVLTTNDPTGPCPPVSATTTIRILKVDCGSFPWDGN